MHQQLENGQFKDISNYFFTDGKKSYLHSNVIDVMFIPRAPIVDKTHYQNVSKCVTVLKLTA